MLSRLNKSNGKSPKSESSPWHPNFRDAARLPDTKTVRTKFFLNAVVITVLLSLALYTAYREINLSALEGELADLEREISELSGPNETALVAYKAYQVEEKKFNDAAPFWKETFSYPDLLIRLGQILPKRVKLTRVEYRGSDQVMNITGSVRGLDAEASSLAADFVDLINADEYFKTTFEMIRLSNLSRNIAEEGMDINVSFTFVGASKPSVATKGKK